MGFPLALMPVFQICSVSAAAALLPLPASLDPSYWYHLPLRTTARSSLRTVARRLPLIPTRGLDDRRRTAIFQLAMPPQICPSICLGFMQS